MKMNGFTWCDFMKHNQNVQQEITANTFYMSQHFKDRLADTGYNELPIAAGVSNRMYEVLVGIFAQKIQLTLELLK